MPIVAAAQRGEPPVEIGGRAGEGAYQRTRDALAIARDQRRRVTVRVQDRPARSTTTAGASIALMARSSADNAASPKLTECQACSARAPAVFTTYLLGPISPSPSPRPAPLRVPRDLNVPINWMCDSFPAVATLRRRARHDGFAPRDEVGRWRDMEGPWRCQAPVPTSPASDTQRSKSRADPSSANVDGAKKKPPRARARSCRRSLVARALLPRRGARAT